MAVSELGWSSLAEAQSYFDNERFETALWEAATMTPDLRNKALNMAYNRLYYHSGYGLPEEGTETPGEHTKLIKIQSEMAYYLIAHLLDEDDRKALQAQGVTDAGIAKEKYHKDLLNKLPIPPIVEEMVEELMPDLGKTMAMIPIARDEDEDMETDVVEE